MRAVDTWPRAPGLGHLDHITSSFSQLCPGTTQWAIGRENRGLHTWGFHILGRCPGALWQKLRTLMPLSSASLHFLSTMQEHQLAGKGVCEARTCRHVCMWTGALGSVMFGFKCCTDHSLPCLDLHSSCTSTLLPLWVPVSCVKTECDKNAATKFAEPQ